MYLQVINMYAYTNQPANHSLIASAENFSPKPSPSPWTRRSAGVLEKEINKNKNKFLAHLPTKHCFFDSQIDVSAAQGFAV